jgi:poly(3-hydroxybutyrate) depolymerase
MLSRLSTLNSRLFAQLAGAVVAAVIIGDVAWLLLSLRPQLDDWQAQGRTGFVCRRHTDGSRYVVFIPHQSPPDEQLPLIVFLNGVGENGDDGVKQISNNFGSAIWELKGRFPFAILATQCRIDGSWSPDSEDARRLLEVLDRTIAEYGIDPDRVFLTGPSAGGNGTWRLGAALADRFAAIVPLASAACDMPESEAVSAYAAANMPVWKFCNRGDVAPLVEYNRRMHSQLVAAGLDARLTEFDADGHDCWTDAYRTPALYDWLWQQSREARSRQSKYRPLFDVAPLSEWTSTGGVPSIDNNVLSVSGDSELVTRQAFDDVEIRFEFLCEAPVPLGIILRRGGAASAAPTEIRGLIDWPQNGSGGFLADGQTWVSVADPVAQRSLALGHWNVVQLLVNGGRATLRLNGLPLCETLLLHADASEWQIGLATRNQHRFRSLRLRPLTSEGSN